MKNTFAIVRMAALLLSVSVTPLFAHHGFQAEYDGSKIIYISGVLTKVEWSNPHLYIHIDAKDSQGKNTEWTFEGASPNVVTRTGTRRVDLVNTIGQMVTIRATPARNTASRGAAETIKMPDGRELVIGGKRYSEGQPERGTLN